MQFSEADSLRVVIDTNVLVSGGTVTTSYPAQVVDLWRTAQISLVISEPLLEELKYVLARPNVQALGWTPPIVDIFLREIRSNSLCVAGTTSVNICRDPDDNALFAAAIEGDAQCIVSGDEDVLAVERYRDIETMKPKDFIQWFQMQHIEEAA